MENNEFLSRMFSCYWGSNVTGYTSTTPVSHTVLSNIVHGITPNCKLILRPLSSISDEGAIEVAKMILLKNIDPDFDFSGCEIETERDDMAVRVLIGDYFYCIAFDGVFIIVPDDLVDASDAIPVGWQCPIFDFMRSKGYDCGFMHIPSLISAGYAIEENIKTNSVHP